MTAGINFGAGRRALLQAFSDYSPSSGTRLYICLFRHFYREIMGTTIMSITITSAKKKIFEVHNIAISSRNHIRADIDPIVSLFSQPGPGP